MEISFLGKTSVRLKNKNLTLVLDPISSKEHADVVVYSGTLEKVAIAGPVNRDKTFVIDREGEYELAGVGVINYGAISILTMDGVIVAYLGGADTNIKDSLMEKLKEVDVILVPLDKAVSFVNQTEPLVAVLIGYETKAEVEKFLSENKFETVKVDLDKLKLDQQSLPENTEIVVLNA